MGQGRGVIGPTVSGPRCAGRPGGARLERGDARLRHPGRRRGNRVVADRGPLRGGAAGANQALDGDEQAELQETDGQDRPEQSRGRGRRREDTPALVASVEIPADAGGGQAKAA